jgi:hypothetical protein
MAPGERCRNLRNGDFEGERSRESREALPIHAIWPSPKENKARDFDPVLCRFFARLVLQSRPILTAAEDQLPWQRRR